MKKIVFITLGDAEFGFQLTGAIQHVAEKENLMDVLNNVTSDPDAGLLVVDERLLAGSNDQMQRKSGMVQDSQRIIKMFHALAANR